MSSISDSNSPGINSVAEYMSAGLPFVTSSIAPAAGSPVRIDFPKVTKSIFVENLATATNTLSIGFTRAGVVSTSNKFILNPSKSILLDARVKQIWLQGETGTPAYNIYAALTTIDPVQMPLLTGSTGGWRGIG